MAASHRQQFVLETYHGLSKLMDGWMDGWYCSEFHTRIVEQIYFSLASELQSAQGNDGLVGWFASQFHALHSSAYPCKTSIGIFARFHIFLDFE